MPDNFLEYEMWGKNALYSEPLSRGSEKMSFPIPTYQSLIGTSESIYWKPSFKYIIDDLRVINPIKVESKSMRPLDKRLALNHNTLAFYTYLSDVRYQVRCHIEWNLQREDLAADRNMKKHTAIFKRALKAGGRRDLFLGTRECQGYVKPQAFDSGDGYYDNVTSQYFGLMFHGYNYPSDTGDPMLSVRMDAPIMKNGVVHFKRPEECKIVQPIRKIKYTGGHDQKLFESVDDLYQQMIRGNDK